MMSGYLDTWANGAFWAATTATQIAVVVWLVARISPQRYRVPVVMSVLACAAALLLLPGLPIRSAGLVLTGGCQAVAYVSLLAWFATSLRRDREPVVTGLARRVRQTMPPKVVRYTRRVTFAWCVFFAAQLGVSAGLLLFAPQAVWSAFVSMLNFPLLVLMVLGEFACRWILFRNEPRTGLIGTLSAMRHARIPAIRP